MDRSGRDCTEAGEKIEDQSQGEEIAPDENITDVAVPEFSLARRLSDDGEEYAREYEELVVTAGNVKTVAALKLYIHKCNLRIGEYIQELKHRDSALSQLGETLSGILNTVQRANEEGQSAAECVRALKTKVSSATEFLSNIYQDRSLTEICESSAFHSLPERSETSSENGVEKVECNHHCQHLKEINKIKEEVLHSLEHLQVPADILMKQRDLDLASNIGELSSQAHKYKCSHEDALAQLHSTKEQSEIMMSKVLNKEEELIKLKSHINDLNVELKAMKDRCNKLEQECKTSTSYFSATDMNHEKTSVEDKSIQSFIDLKMMNRFLEISPCNFPNLSFSSDMPCGANVLRTEDEKCSAVQVNVNSSFLNYANFAAKLGKGDREEKPCSITSNSEVENQNVPSKSSSLTPSKIENNYSVEVKVDLEMPVDCDAMRENEGYGVNDMSSVCESNHLDINAVLHGSSSPEEVLLDLCTKARHLSVIERQLKIMKDRENTLRCQLKSAMDSCNKVEKRCKSAEKLAMDLQRDLEKLLCERGTSETDKSGSLVDVSKNEENEMPFIKSILHAQHNDENQGDKFLKESDSSSMENEEFIPTFLHRFWNKMQLAFDVITKINEEKTDLFFPKRVEPLRASVENDICQLAWYLKRKDEVLMQARMLLEAECLQNVNTQSDPTHQSNWEEGESDENVLKCVVEKNGSAEDILSSLSKLHEEMGAINSQVLKCMKYCMEKEHEIQTAELKIHHANDVASIKQHHVLQLKNLMEEVSEKMIESQGKTAETIMSESSRSWEVEARDIEIKDSYKQELEAVWADVDEKHREALKNIFNRITAEQISLATKMYKESYDLKVSEEINLLRSVHQQEIEAVKASLKHEKELEVLHARQEMSKNSKDYVNEMIKAVESGLKGLQSKCYEVALKASIANETALDDLKKNVIKVFQGTLMGFGEAWLKKFEKGANVGEENNSDGDTMSGMQNSGKLCKEMMSKEPQIHSQDSFVNLRSTLISMSEGHIKEMAEWQFECMKELMEKLQSEQSRFKLKLLEVHWNNGSHVVSVEDNADLIEKKSEAYSVNQNIYSLLGAGDEAWISDIKALKKELEGKHAKEMESLRLYFEKKCAEVEKRYSEDVLTQRSIKHSGTGSSEGSSNASIVGSAAELESDNFFLNPEDTLPPRNLEEHEKEGLDLQLMVNQGMSYEERRVSHGASNVIKSIKDINFQIVKSSQIRFSFSQLCK